METISLPKFCLNTKNSCFLCNGIISTVPRVLTPRKRKYFSIKSIFHYLKISLEEFNSLLNNSSETLSEREVHVSLCTECEKILETFLEQYKVLEMTKMKLKHNLEMIHKRLDTGSNTPEASSSTVKTALGIEARKHSKLVEELRSKINEKCELKINQLLPVIIKNEEIAADPDSSYFNHEMKSEVDKTLSNQNPGIIVKAELAPDESEENPEEFFHVETSDAQKDLLKIFHDESEDAVNDMGPSPPNNIPGTDKEVSHKCHICGKTFAYKGTATKHMLRHSSVASFKCKYCQMAFHFKMELVRHMGIHTSERPHKCPTCHQRFSQKSNLNQHVKDVHAKPIVPKGIKRFRCSQCGKIFNYKKLAEEHIGKRRCQPTKTVIILSSSNSGIKSISGTPTASWQVT